MLPYLSMHPWLQPLTLQMLYCQQWFINLVDFDPNRVPLFLKASSWAMQGLAIAIDYRLECNNKCEELSRGYGLP
jgi:hypothetical protein